MDNALHTEQKKGLYAQTLEKTCQLNLSYAANKKS